MAVRVMKTVMRNDSHGKVCAVNKNEVFIIGENRGNRGQILSVCPSVCLYECLSVQEIV